MIALIRVMVQVILLSVIPLNGYAYDVPKVIWQYDAQHPIWSSPALTSNDSVVIGTDNSTVISVTSQGQLAWSFNADGRVFSSPVIDGQGEIYFGTENGSIYKLSNSGVLLWSFNISKPINATISLDSLGNIYFSADDGFLRSLTSSGSLRWQIDLGGISDSSSVVVHDDLIVAATRNGNLVGVDSRGEISWTQTLGIISSSPAIGLNGTIYIGTWQGSLFALNPSGEVLWEVVLNETIWSSPSITKNNDIIISSTSGTLFSVSKDGVINWSYLLDGYIDASPIIGVQDVIYIAQRNNRISALGTDGTLHWHFELPHGVFSTPTISNQGQLIVATVEGDIIGLNAGFSGLANTFWPKRGQNQGNTSNVVISTSNTIENFELPSLEDIARSFKVDSLWTLQTISNYESLALTSPQVNAPASYGLVYSDNTFRGLLSFDFKVAGSANALLSLYINETLVSSWEGETNLTRYVYPLEAGQNNVLWQFTTSDVDNVNTFVQIDNIASPIKNNNLRQDMTGDGVDDYIVMSLSDRQLKIRRSDTEDYEELGITLSCNEIPFVGDKDGDGISEIWVRETETGFVKIYQSDGEFAKYFGSYASDLPVFADYDGDGKSNIAIRRPNSGHWIVLDEAGQIDRSYFGAFQTDIPIQGDYDGDGIIDMAFRRPSSGHFVVKFSKTGSLSRIYFGSEVDDIPTPNDFDGDGITDIAVLRKNEDQFQWIVRDSTKAGTAYRRVIFDSLPLDTLPLFGDFNGDGKGDFAFYLPATFQSFYWNEEIQTYIELSRDMPNGEIPISLHVNEKMSRFLSCDSSIQSKTKDALKSLPSPTVEFELEATQFEKVRKGYN